MTDHVFCCNEEGYVRHWLIAGPRTSSYSGPPGSDDAMRQAAVDESIVAPPTRIALDGESPLGEPWRFHWPGFNVFVEQSAFYHQLEVLELWAATDLRVPTEWRLPCRLWAVGTMDLYVNGQHVKRHSVPKYMFPQSTEVVLPLYEGVNRLVVRLQGLGVRDTRFLLGLQLLTSQPDPSSASEVAVLLPGSESLTARLVVTERWLQSVRAEEGQRLVADEAPPVAVTVKRAGEWSPWADSEREFPLARGSDFQVEVRTSIENTTLARQLEVPVNRPRASEPAGSLADHQAAYVRRCAEKRGGARDGVQAMLARHLAGCPHDELDAQTLTAALASVDERNDCADFTLAMLLRLRLLDALQPAMADRLRDTLLRFRYWSDEPGTDAMCFGSENHSLLFHGCQMLAGQLLPDETFATSGHVGGEQARLGEERCRAWLDRVEKHGYLEFLSSTYMPITVAALMNLVDFAADESLRRRAAAQVDRILRELALHSFDGVFVAPQGRVYRGILYPETSSAQALLSYCTTAAVQADTGWAMFLASSPTYRPPEDLDSLMCEPVTTTLQHEKVATRLVKTRGYMLASGLLESGDLSQVGQFNAVAGAPGYQEHAWHATLGRECHVFVNHPGAHFDLTSSRPGYWYGNGILPTLSVEGATVAATYRIPETHPVGFTHAHWPSEVFDEEHVTDQWAFGAHGSGYVALWCSQPLRRHNEVLTGRELRAEGRDVAWVCRCAEQAEFGSLQAFEESCLAAGVAVE